MIKLLFMLFTLWLWSITLHELGHFLYFRWIAKRNVEIRFYYENRKKWGFKVGYPLDYKMLKGSQKYEVYSAGIFLGFLPIIIAFFFNILYGILIPYYLIIGCKHDFKRIRKWIKE